jgi:gas vesicle protein
MAPVEETGLTATSNPFGPSFVVGMALGALVGAAVGLMLARKPGAEFRRDVAHTASRLGRQASAAYTDAATAVSGAVGRGRRAWQDARHSMGEPSPSDGRAQADGVI